MLHLQAGQDGRLQLGWRIIHLSKLFLGFVEGTEAQASARGVVEDIGW
jgi:hypothetical protein